jgi:hypothetical protein
MAIVIVAGGQQSAMGISGLPDVIRNGDGHRDGAEAPAR